MQKFIDVTVRIPVEDLNIDGRVDYNSGDRRNPENYDTSNEEVSFCDLTINCDWEIIDYDDSQVEQYLKERYIASK